MANCPDYSNFTVEVIECCTLVFKNGDGDTAFVFDLNNTIAINSPVDKVKIKDNCSTLTISTADLLLLGYTIDQINSLAAICRCGGDNSAPFEIVCVEENDSLYLISVDTASIPATIQVFDSSGNDVTGTVTPIRCQDITVDTEKEFFCIDGLDFTRNDCIKKDENGVFLSVESFWQDRNGIVVLDPTAGATLVSKGACKICNPAWESFTGSNATLAGWNKLSLFVPKCCAVQITTSAGTIQLPAQPSAWNFCEVFECLVTGFELTSTNGCDINEITTILTKSA